MIESIALCKRFGDRELFNNLSFKIEDGEFVCFVGESSKGKTTLLNIIGQIEAPTSGKLLFDGKELQNNQQRLDFLRRRVGFIFQNFALVDGKTVEQNLLLVRKSDREDCTVLKALEIVGLADKANEKVYTLSGGEQQRVALARLFIKKCDIILADEPTGSLDSKNAAVVMDILKKLNRNGKTVILVTHDEAVKRICDRTINL